MLDGKNKNENSNLVTENKSSLPNDDMSSSINDLDDDEGIIIILKRSRIGVGCLVEENSAITDCKYICI